MGNRRVSRCVVAICWGIRRLRRARWRGEPVKEQTAQIEGLFRQYAGVLYRDLLGYCGCEQTAEEITQQAFLRLYDKLKSGESLDRPDAWVFAEGRRLLLDQAGS